MTVSKERKAELTAQFGNSPVDTGNPKVQVATCPSASRS